MILDNFETPWEHADQQTGLTTLLGHLNSLPNLTLIVTMRGKVRPDGVSWSTLSLTSLPPLDLVSACDAFSAVAGIKHVDESELRTLMGILDGVPLAIVLMAKLAQVGGNITDLIDQWNSDQTSMLADQFENRLLNVEYSIQLSMKSPRMEQCPEAFTLLQIISMLPNGVDKAHLDKIATGLGRKTTKAVHLLQEVELAYQDRGRYKVLSPIRAYTQSKHPPAQETAEEVKQFYWDLVATYSTDVSETGDITMLEPDLLHAEMGNLSYLLAKALKEEVDEDVIQATYDLTTLLYWTTPSNELLEALLGKSGLHWEPLLKAKCFQLHSDIASRTGNLQQATTSISSAKSLFEDMENYLGVAQCLQSLGDMAKVQNNHILATGYFTKALELFQQEDGKLGYAQSLLSLAQVECVAGNYWRAQELFQDALKHFQILEDVVGTAQCYVGLGEVAQAQDKYPVALQRYTHAKEQFMLVGHTAGANQCLQSLAVTAAMQGKFHKATSQLLQAKDQFHKVGDILGEMQCIQALGDVARLQGRGPDAQNFLQTARIFFQHFGDQLASIQCLQSLGDVAVDEGDYALGEDLLNKALAYYDQTGRRLERAQSRMSLGRAAGKQGLFDRAESYLPQSLAEFTAIQERRGAADCTQVIGRLHQAKGESAEALKELVHALREYQEMGSQLGVAECQEHIGTLLGLAEAEKAEAILEEAVAGYERAGVQRGLRRCQETLARLRNKVPGEFVTIQRDTITHRADREQGYLSLIMPVLIIVGSLALGA